MCLHCPGNTRAPLLPASLEQQFLKLCTQGYELCPQILPPTSLVPGCCRTTPGGAIHTAMSVNVPGMCEVWLTQTQGPLGRAD